jgi:hypothetical protein
MNANYAMTPLRHPRAPRQSLLHGLTLLRPAARRPRGEFHRDAPSRRHRLPPTRAARSSRSRGVFLAPSKRMLSVAVAAAALFALAAMLGTARVIDSPTFNANAGPPLVASASLAPAPIAALQH